MPVYSHSRISTYETCPLQYKFAYVDRIKRYVEGIEAFLGSRCHDVLEKLYKDKLKGKENSLEELQQYFDDIWEKRWHDEIKIVKKEYTQDHYKNIGHKAIRDYYKRYYPFKRGNTLALEKLVKINFNGNNGEDIKLQGYIDRLVEIADGEYEIHDYKTSGSLPEQSKLDSDRQLALYQIGVEQLWSNCKKIHLVWHYLVFDKEIRSYRSAKDIRELEKLTSSVVAEIEQATENNTFEPKESHFCDWCYYPDLCPKRKHLFLINNLNEKEYKEEDGVKLVNKYAKLTKKYKEYKNEYENEKSKIEEDLIDYAKRNKLEQVAGENHTVGIKFGKKISYPKTGDANRENLDKLLIEMNLWDKVSTLSSSKLSKVLQKNGLSDEQISKITEFQNIDEKTSFSLKKRGKD